MKTGRSLEELTNEVRRQLETKKDYLMSTGTIDVMLIDRSPQASFSVNSQSLLYGFGEIAREQLASLFYVPQRYEDMLWQEHPSLWQQTMEYFLKQYPSNRLVRTLDGRIRAVVSDKYRPLDNWDLLQIAEPIISQAGCRFEDCQITERKLYLKAVTDRVQGEVVGDVVQAGVIITNSEVGKGALCVQPLLYTLSCKNGAVVNQLAKRQAHLGAKLLTDNDEAEEYYADTTKQAVDRAFWFKFRDTVKWALSEATFNNCLQVLNKAAESLIETPRSEAVEVIVKRHQLQESERDMILHFFDDGPKSLYGLGNAITRTAQEVQSYDRSVELETIGWRVMAGQGMN